MSQKEDRLHDIAHCNAEVVERDGQKTVNLRSVDRSTHPWTYAVVETARAANHVHPHVRNCDFEGGLRNYFKVLIT